MRKRGRFGSLLCATIAVAMAALIGAAGFGSAALAQQARTASIAADDLFWPNTVDFKPGAGAVARLVNIVHFELTERWVLCADLTEGTSAMRYAIFSPRKS